MEAPMVEAMHHLDGVILINVCTMNLFFVDNDDKDNLSRPAERRND